MLIKEIKSFLDQKASAYENINFLDKDPISIPHRFNKKKILKYQDF